jgi:hypothetical protein
VDSVVVYAILSAVVILLVTILLQLVRRGASGGVGASLPSVLDSLAKLSSVESQVASLSSAHALVAQDVHKLEVTLKGLETKLAESTGEVKATLSRDVGDARRVLMELKARFEDRSRLEDEMHGVTRRIERVLVGARTRGESGENILADAFAEFPPEMIDRDFRVGGKVVEYAIVLPNKKRLPVDSKWSGMEVVDRIHKESDPERIKRLESDLERDVEKKVREVATYIDPTSTTDIAIAAVPDSVYGHCRKAHIEGFKVGVLLMAYSMVVPYVLALYHLHLRMARSIEFENIEAYLVKIERSLDEIDKIAENKIARAGAMVSNAYTECKQIIGSMRAATAFLRELPEVGAVTQARTLGVEGMETCVSNGEHGSDVQAPEPGGRQEDGR